MGSREAQHVFILMKRDYRVSRNVRATWYFQHLHKPILQAADAQVSFIASNDGAVCYNLQVLQRFSSSLSFQRFSDDLEVIGVLPIAQSAGEAPMTETDDSSPQQYVVTPSTVVTFLAKRYRLVFLLDLSPSLAVVVRLSPSK